MTEPTTQKSVTFSGDGVKGGKNVFDHGKILGTIEKSLERTDPDHYSGVIDFVPFAGVRLSTSQMHWISERIYGLGMRIRLYGLSDVFPPA